MNPREWEEHDLELLLVAARERKIALIVGSAGGAGTTRGVGEYVEIVRELAAKHRPGPFRLATIHSEVPLDYLRERAKNETIRPLDAPARLTAEMLDRTSRVVAMMGVEPYFKAFDLGAEVVIAGRSCDDAICASLPLRVGFPKGLSYHLGKTKECSSLVGTPSMAKETVLGTITDEYVELELRPRHR
jgi:hypothetical protein